MDSNKVFDINYEPRKDTSQFILFAELQEDHFAIQDENGVIRFGEEIVAMKMHPVEYFEKYDALYYDSFTNMVNDISWILECIGDRSYPIVFHEIDDIDKWLKKAEEFEKNVKNSLMLLFHPMYKYHFDLLWRML